MRDWLRSGSRKTLHPVSVKWSGSATLTHIVSWAPMSFYSHICCVEVAPPPAKPKKRRKIAWQCLNPECNVSRSLIYLSAGDWPDPTKKKNRDPTKDTSVEIRKKQTSSWKSWKWFKSINLLNIVMEWYYCRTYLLLVMFENYNLLVNEKSDVL